jgi:hypothetical protein
MNIQPYTCITDHPLPMKSSDPLLLLTRESAYYELNIAIKAKITIYQHYIYMHKCYLPKKAKGKGQE